MTGRPSGSPYRGKRALDLALVVFLGGPACVMCLVCASLVLLVDGPPVLFRQERMGRDAVSFHVTKFRTMKSGPNPVFPDASRITTTGRWLRRTSLDELPQLWDVARGKMSVVGPRPTLRYQVDRYTPRQRQRLAVRPGLTGLAQVRGRNSLAWAERIDLDLEYVQRQSALYDLWLLLLTVRVVLSGGGTEGHPLNDPLAIPPTEVVP